MANNTKFFKEADEYLAFNALTKLNEGKDSAKNDQIAVEKYMEIHVKPKTRKFNNVHERMKYLVDNDYYEAEIVNQVTKEQLEELYKIIAEFDHHFLLLWVP